MDQIYPKNVFRVENRKSEHRNGVLHIRISLITKVSFKLKMFRNDFAQKGDVRSKTEKSEHHHLHARISLNLEIDFYILKLA